MPESDEHDATFYDEQYYDANGQQDDRPALKLYARLVRRYLQPTSALDVGCGTGHLLKRLNEICPSDGLEVSAYSAARARLTSVGSTVFENPSELPDARYDAVTAIHVLEHLSDDIVLELFSQLRRAVKPGARAFFVMPDPAGRAAQLHGPAWNALTDPTHINMKPHAEWREFFLAEGFTVERDGTDGMWNFPYSRMPRPLDAMRYGLPMAAQFAAGRMFLKPGGGESSFFVLRWP